MTIIKFHYCYGKFINYHYFLYSECCAFGVKANELQDKYIVTLWSIKLTLQNYQKADYSVNCTTCCITTCTLCNTYTIDTHYTQTQI